MEFLYFVSVCVFIFLFIKMNKEIKNLKDQNNFLNRKMSDLYNKAQFNYEQIKKIQNDSADLERQNLKNRSSPVSHFQGTNTESAEVKENQPINSAADVIAENKASAAKFEPVLNMTAGNEKPIAASSHVHAEAQNSHSDSKHKLGEELQNQKDNTNTHKVNPYAFQNKADGNERKSVPAPVQPVHTSVQNNIPQGAFSRNPAPQYVQTQGYRNSAQDYVKNTKRPDEKPQLKSFENWLGTRLFNVVASLMIFIGLVLFCTLGYEYITDTMKMAAMFIVSGGFIALGAFFTRQNKSVFSLGLTGCGFGAFFISVLLSHVYFGAITDVVAFGLLLIWAVLALYMSKKLDSVMLSVTAHMGTAISICFAFSLGFSAERIILPVVYQFASIAVIILGNIFCCKKTYRFGLFMSMLLLVYTSIVMCSTFSPVPVMPGEVSALFTSVIFIVQLLVLSFVSYLISVSTAHLESNGSKYPDIPYMLHAANKALWTAGIITIAGFVTFFIVRNLYNVNSIIYPTMAICIAAICHLLTTLFMSEKLDFSEKLSKISIWFISVLVMLVLFVQCVERGPLHGISFLFVYIGLIMLIIRYTKNKKLNHLVSFLIGCDMLFMCFYGYFAAANVVISIAYMVVIGLMILLHWFSQSGESREKRFTLLKVAEYLWISVSIIPINISEFSGISIPLILSEFALMNIIAFLCRYGRDNEPGLKLAVKIESLITIFTSIIFITIYQWGYLGNVLPIRVVFVVMSGILTALCAYDFIKSGETGMQLISAAAAAGYATAVYIGLAGKIENSYIKILLGKPMSLPFFFIAAVMLVVIYRLNGNHRLRPFIWVSLSFDMAFKLFFGYFILIMNNYYSVGTHALSMAVSVIHSGIITFMMYCLWRLQDEIKKPSTLIGIKIVAYFWFSVSMTVIAFMSTELPCYKDIGFTVLTLINVIVYITKYHADEKRIVNRTVKITSTIVLYISIMIIASHIRSDTVSYAVRFALILSCVGLYYLISREIMKSRSPLAHAGVGLTATLIVNASCEGLSNVFEIAYIFSIVTMITALICIAAGFAAKAKGLRVYGLIIVMLCVIKLVTIDISGADSMSRVAAFIVGGIICFIISGIYNKVESKLVKSGEEKT